MKDYYAEQPIALKVSGQYHDIASFTADVSNLSRIVTLHDLNIASPQQQGNGPRGGDGHLVMEATARTYRYLDPAEVEEQKRTQQQAGKKK
jgi:type IV pilus assembly protein PilO